MDRVLQTRADSRNWATLQICVGGFGDDFRGAFVDGGEVDEIAAYAQGAGSGAEKALGSLQRDAAGGNELELRKWSEQAI